MTKILAPGDTVGILGGGQLGRMLALAAARLGLNCHIFEPQPSPPAGQVAHRVTTADYDDHAALRAFAGSVDVVTFEFENIPLGVLDTIESVTNIYPPQKALAVSQDRVAEKGFLTDLGFQVAPYAPVDTPADFDAAVAITGTPAILKTRRFGYDGKGQLKVTEEAISDALRDLMQSAPCVLESFVDFTREISVIGARNPDGQVACFDPGENVHKNGILSTTTVPAQLTAAQRTDAVILTGRIMNALNYVGVMGVELFVTPAGLLVNEIAPRVHNSGHWTQNGCVIDQFEQHIRAVAGWPMGDARRHSNVTMTNLIGNAVQDIDGLRGDPDVALHLYGKAEVRAGRKMGHSNRITGPA